MPFKKYKTFSILELFFVKYLIKVKEVSAKMEVFIERKASYLESLLHISLVLLNAVSFSFYTGQSKPCTWPAFLIKKQSFPIITSSVASF